MSNLILDISDIYYLTKPIKNVQNYKHHKHIFPYLLKNAVFLPVYTNQIVKKHCQ